MDINRSDKYEEFTEKDPLKDEIKIVENVNRKWQDKCIGCIRNVTVEPCLLFYVVAYMINSLATQNLALEKACRVNLNYSDEICTSLRLQTIESQSKYEIETQKLIAAALTWKTYMTASLPCIIVLLVGPWSDKTGSRKIFIIITLSGQLLISVTNIINAYFMKELNLEYLIFSEAIIESISGSVCVGIFSMFSFIGVVTTNKTRTYRMGVVNFCHTAAIPLGMMLGGILLEKLDYYGSYGFNACVLTVILIYSIFILKDPSRTKEQELLNNRGIWFSIRLFFALTNIKEPIKLVFKTGSRKRRLQLILLLLAEFVVFGPIAGEAVVVYISTRYRFNWDEVKFSIFQTVNFILHSIGTLISVWVLSKTWQWHDSALGVMSTLSKIFGSFFYCFATSEKIFYIAPIVDMFNGMCFIAVKSSVSKIVEPDELGKANSLISLMESTAPLIYVPIYTKVYVATLRVLPGAVFLMGSAMSLPGLVVFMTFWYKNRKASRRRTIFVNGKDPEDNEANKMCLDVLRKN